MKKYIVTSLLIACVAFTSACPGGATSVVTCATAGGKRIAERVGGELAQLWGRDRDAWAARALELAREHGRSFLYCVADALEASHAFRSQSDHTAALRSLAAERV